MFHVKHLCCLHAKIAARRQGGAHHSSFAAFSFGAKGAKEKANKKKSAVFLRALPRDPT